MKTERSTPPLHPLTPFERLLVERHNMPGHMARTLADIRGGHR